MYIGCNSDFPENFDKMKGNGFKQNIKVNEV